MDLYALPPEQFTAARDAAAKQDKALKELRRPTVSAWVVNTLVRRDRALLDDLLALGAELSRAQAAGQGDLLRELGEQRRRQVPAVVDRAAALVDRPLSPAVRAEVVGTLEAALADPASAEAVTSGRLVRALEFAGFGGVDLEGAVAGPTEPSSAAPAPGAARQRCEPPHPDPAAGTRARAPPAGCGPGRGGGSTRLPAPWTTPSAAPR